jgi:hypothetical protein
LHARYFFQGFFDTRNTGGTGHALNAKVKG